MSGVGSVPDRFEFLATRMFRRRHEEIRPFATSHSDRQVLTGLAAAYLTVRFCFDPSLFLMVWCVHRVVDYFVPLQGIIVIDESHTGLNLIAALLEQSSPGAFDEGVIVILGWFDENLRDRQNVGITAQTDQDTGSLNELLSTIDTQVVIVQRSTCFPRFDIVLMQADCHLRQARLRYWGGVD